MVHHLNPLSILTCCLCKTRFNIFICLCPCFHISLLVCVYCILFGQLSIGCRFPKLICASVHVGISVLLLLFVLWSWLEIEVKTMFCTVYYFIFVCDGTGLLHSNGGTPHIIWHDICVSFFMDMNGTWIPNYRYKNVPVICCCFVAVFVVIIVITFRNAGTCRVLPFWKWEERNCSTMKYLLVNYTFLFPVIMYVMFTSKVTGDRFINPWSSTTDRLALA